MVGLKSQNSGSTIQNEKCKYKQKEKAVQNNPGRLF